MILRLCLNQMVLQSSEHELSLRQRQPDGLGRILINRRAAANLVNADGSIRPDHLHHDPPLHPVPWLPDQADRSTPRFWTVSVYKDELGQHTRNAPSRRLWHALLDIDGYLRGQSSWLVNYAKRYRAELRVGTSITEGTANFLVNRRVNKSQQMVWSPRGADLLLQVRCAVYNGTLRSGLGHLFQPHANQNERSANPA